MQFIQGIAVSPLVAVLELWACVSLGPGLRWQASAKTWDRFPQISGLIRPSKSKGGEESNGKLPHNAICQEQSGPYSWFPDAWIKQAFPQITYFSAEPDLHQN
ncbi:hypothetical protein PoB_003002100 [Plakobranchus ocellatus]|uniref:Secreted protein n=1 Tax=Plakobranchus ocellatus TaxID=259542 RepID=A0AAV4A5I2_9GAST|nr:hypothetical protein PoB_003002100 [Plakobranchus ocellatus]